MTSEEIEKYIEYVKATMAFEDMELDQDTIKLFRKYLSGEYTGEEVRKIILSKYLSEECTSEETKKIIMSQLVKKV